MRRASARDYGWLAAGLVFTVALAALFVDLAGQPGDWRRWLIAPIWLTAFYWLIAGSWRRTVWSRRSRPEV